MEILNEIELDGKYISFDFIRSSGPGGQNVNRVATAVRLRFDVESSDLPGSVKTRLKKIAGDRLNREGVLTIKASCFRTQEQNRQDALARLMTLVKKAYAKPKKRIRTRPTRASRERTLASKKKRGLLKKMRSKRVEA